MIEGSPFDTSSPISKLISLFTQVDLDSLTQTFTRIGIPSYSVLSST